jgi:hypothetical protein
MLSLTCFICENVVDPNRLYNVELGTELRRKQSITDVEEPCDPTSDMDVDGQSNNEGSIHRCMSAVDSESSS